MSTRRISRGASASLLFFFLAVNSFAQMVQVQGKTFQLKKAIPGETYSIEFFVRNPTNNTVKIMLLKGNYVQDLKRKNNIAEAGTGFWDNSSWIQIKNPHLLLDKQREAKIVLPVHVPEILAYGDGSYSSVILVRTAPVLVKGKEGHQVKMAFQVAVQIVTDIGEGKKSIKVLKAEYLEGYLYLTVKNDGTKLLVLTMRHDIEGLEKDHKIRIYPTGELRVKLKCDLPEDGRLYKDKRILFDDGGTFLMPQFITFRCGEEVQIIAEKLKGRKLKKAKSRSMFRPRLFAVLSYGNDFKSISLAGSLNLFRFISLRGGSNYREFDPIANKVLTHRGGIGLNFKNIGINYSAYIYEHDVFQLVDARIHYKGFRTNFSYTPNRRTLQGSVSQRFWGRWNLRVYGYFDFERERQRGIVSLSIPIF